MKGPRYSVMLACANLADDPVFVASLASALWHKQLQDRGHLAAYGY